VDADPPILDASSYHVPPSEAMVGAKGSKPYHERKARSPALRHFNRSVDLAASPAPVTLVICHLFLDTFAHRSL
jgi:hypothetical protein